MTTSASSAIDVTVPVFGSPTTASVRANFAAAKAEIEDLRARVAELENAFRELVQVMAVQTGEPH